MGALWMQWDEAQRLTRGALGAFARIFLHVEVCRQGRLPRAVPEPALVLLYDAILFWAATDVLRVTSSRALEPPSMQSAAPHLRLGFPGPASRPSSASLDMLRVLL